MPHRRRRQAVARTTAGAPACSHPPNAPWQSYNAESQDARRNTETHNEGGVNSVEWTSLFRVMLRAVQHACLVPHSEFKHPTSSSVRGARGSDPERGLPHLRQHPLPFPLPPSRQLPRTVARPGIVADPSKPHLSRRRVRPRVPLLSSHTGPGRPLFHSFPFTPPHLCFGSFAFLPQTASRPRAETRRGLHRAKMNLESGSETSSRHPSSESLFPSTSGSIHILRDGTRSSALKRFR